jgi:hypothetical protein
MKPVRAQKLMGGDNHENLGSHVSAGLA